MTTRQDQLPLTGRVTPSAADRRPAGRPAHLVLSLRGFLGRHVSVRWKLTLWYGIMCALTLGVIGLGMRYALQAEIHRSIDSGLVGTANTLLPALSQPGPPVDSRNPSESTQRCINQQALGRLLQWCSHVQDVLTKYSSSPSTAGQFEQVQIVDRSAATVGGGLRGSVLLYSVGTPKVNGLEGVLVLGLPLNAALAKHHNAFADVRDPVALRAYVTPLSPPTDLQERGVVAVLEVFQKETNYSEIQSAFNVILLLAIPLGLIIALLAGWWITRAALRPIDRISRTVARIGESRDLSRRIRSVGPQDELGRLANTFDHMMDRLEQAFEQQKRFVADASHELRTPLTAIRGNADLMKYAPPEERELCVASIRREAERMSRLVADLLLLAEADADQHSLHLQPVDLCDLMMDVHRSAELIAAGKVEVTLEPAEDVTVMGDADRIKQLVLNLVENAVKFTPRGGRVTLSLYAERGGARIEVADTGVGIPAEERDAIFHRFYRVEESRSTRGSGLGLAICAWVVAAHDGEIDLESDPGRGTRFIVRLPAAGPAVRDVPEAVASAR